MSGAAAFTISAGEEHTCVVLTGGGVMCWGSNEFGQLGIGMDWTSALDEYFDAPVNVLGELYF